MRSSLRGPHPVDHTGWSGTARSRIAYRRAVALVFALWQAGSTDGTNRYRVGDDGLTGLLARSSDGSRWDSMHRLWCYPDVLLFQIVSNVSVLFPVEQAPEEMKQFILSRAPRR